MLDCVPGRLITFTHENIVGVYNKMAQYAQDFQAQSQGLLSYIQSQLASAVSWTALPGQLNKIVASSGGYVWGFNSGGGVYTCKEPCNGQNWRGIESPPRITGMPYDIAVDDQNVYILYNVPPPPPPAVIPTHSIKTGQINIGDVGMPPGHITAFSGGLVVSAVFLGEAGAGVAAAMGSGEKFRVVLKDNRGRTATFTATGVGTNPEWQGPPWMYSFSGSDGDAPSLDKIFTGSRSLSLSMVTTTPPKPPSASGPSSPLSFSMRSVDGSGGWSEPKQVPGTPPANPTIHLTDQFMFVGTQGCSKPCTTGSWVPISQPAGSQGIVAASGGSTYASATSAGGGQAVYQSSANGQGGWKEQAGLAGVIPLAVEGDNKFILGVSQSSQRPVRCSQPYTNENSCKIDPTITYKPMPGVHTMSLNPRSYQTYVAAASSGPSGNIYQRVDPGSIDNSAALDQTTQYTAKMDNNVNALGTAATNQYAMIEVAKVKKEADAVIKQITDISEERQSTAHERENIKRKIETVGGPASQWKIQVLQIIAVTLALVLVTYFGLGFVVPPVVNMSIAVVGMAVGLGFAIYFAVNKQ
jgi:hypothetical protein